MVNNCNLAARIKKGDDWTGPSSVGHCWHRNGPGILIMVTIGLVKLSISDLDG